MNDRWHHRWDNQVDWPLNDALLVTLGLLGLPRDDVTGPLGAWVVGL